MAISTDDVPTLLTQLAAQGIAVEIDGDTISFTRTTAKEAAQMVPHLTPDEIARYIVIINGVIGIAERLKKLIEKPKQPPPKQHTLSKTPPKGAPKSGRKASPDLSRMLGLKRGHAAKHSPPAAKKPQGSKKKAR